MFLLVVTAALKLEPDTTFLVNANVPKNLSSADLSNKNNDFLLTSLDILALFFFSSLWSDSQTSVKKVRQDSTAIQLSGVEALCQDTDHTFPLSLV